MSLFPHRTVDENLMHDVAYTRTWTKVVDDCSHMHSRIMFNIHDIDSYIFTIDFTRCWTATLLFFMYCYFRFGNLLFTDLGTLVLTNCIVTETAVVEMKH
jgi:hypothetical protein